VTPNEIFYHWTKVKVKQEKLKLEKNPQSLKSGYKKVLIVELTRATADSSKERDNIVPEIKTTLPKTLF